MTKRLGIAGQVMLLAALYIFLYAPILYIVYVSMQQDSIWPFPPNFTFEHYQRVDSSAKCNTTKLMR